MTDISVIDKVKNHILKVEELEEDDLGIQSEEEGLDISYKIQINDSYTNISKIIECVARFIPMDENGDGLGAINMTFPVNKVKDREGEFYCLKLCNYANIMLDRFQFSMHGPEEDDEGNKLEDNYHVTCTVGMSYKDEEYTPEDGYDGVKEAMIKFFGEE